MLVLSKDELEKFAKTVDMHLMYDVKNHSVLPENNKNNVIDLGRLTPNDLEIVDLNNRERCEKLIKKGFVTVSFCDKGNSKIKYRIITEIKSNIQVLTKARN